MAAGKAAPAITPAEVDRYFVLHQKSIQPERLAEDKEFEALKRKIRVAFEDHPADESVLLTGIRSQLLVGEKGMEKRLDAAGRKTVFGLLKKVLKREADVWALFSITVSAAKEHLGAATVDQLLVEALTGYRRLTPSSKRV
jgi:hypothetical protein